MHAVEHPASRQLAVTNARRVVGLSHRPDWAALAARTWLGALPEPWTVAWSIAYQITHLTDWGARPEGLPEPMRDYLRTWLSVWLDVWTEIGEWDLVGELLIVDSCIGEPVTGSSGWEALAAVQRADGLVPRDAEPVDEDPESAIRLHEHTAVVAVVAATVTLPGRSAAPARRPGERAGPGRPGRATGGRDLYFHSGGTRGFTTFVGFSPHDATAVAVLANTAPALDGRLIQAGYEVLRAAARDEL